MAARSRCGFGAVRALTGAGLLILPGAFAGSERSHAGYKNDAWEVRIERNLALESRRPGIGRVG